MEIKQSTLIKVCSCILLITIIIAIGYNTKSNKDKKSEQLTRIIDDYNRAINREYRLLVSQYDDIIETIKNSDYSYSFRYEYVKKLNKLLKQDKYYTHYNESETVNSCMYRLSSERSEDLKLLKSAAIDKIIDTD